MTSPQRALFVHARPGDETLFTGATIATLLERGGEAIVLACTGDGDELAQRCAALGVTEARILGAPDARWPDREPRTYSAAGADALTSAELGEVAADIAAVIHAVQPDVVVSVGEGTGDAHRERVHDAVRRATEVLRVPFYVVGARAAARAVKVDAAPVLDRKRAVLAGNPEPSGLAAPEVLTRLRPSDAVYGTYAIYNRIFAGGSAFALGAFAGTVLTASHQAHAGGFPWGILVAIAITAAALVGLRLVFHSRAIALCFAIGLLGTSALLAAVSIGGSVLVPANPAGYAWTFAPVLIALVVLGWPRVRAQGRPVRGR